MNVAGMTDNINDMIPLKESSKEILVGILSRLEFGLHKIYVPILSSPILLGGKAPLRHLLDM